MIYPVAIRPQNTTDNRTNFVANVPDLPDLHIEGETMADVIRNAQAVITTHLQARAEKNQPIRSGQDISVHLDNPDFFGCTWAIISLDSLRFTQAILNYPLSLPKMILDSIYEHVGENADTDVVDGFIVDAIKQKLSQLSAKSN